MSDLSFEVIIRPEGAALDYGKLDPALAAERLSRGRPPVGGGGMIGADAAFHRPRRPEAGEALRWRLIYGRWITTDGCSTGDIGRSGVGNRAASSSQREGEA